MAGNLQEGLCNGSKPLKVSVVNWPSMLHSANVDLDHRSTFDFKTVYRCSSGWVRPELAYCRLDALSSKGSSALILDKLKKVPDQASHHR